jgi:hypothetical protein
VRRYRGGPVKIERYRQMIRDWTVHNRGVRYRDIRRGEKVINDGTAGCRNTGRLSDGTGERVRFYEGKK